MLEGYIGLQQPPPWGCAAEEAVDRETVDLKRANNSEGGGGIGALSKINRSPKGLSKQEGSLGSTIAA